MEPTNNMLEIKTPPPDQGGLNLYTGVIESKDRTVDRVLAEISDSQENYDGTIELIADGIMFDPWVG